MYVCGYVCMCVCVCMCVHVIRSVIFTYDILCAKGLTLACNYVMGVHFNVSFDSIVVKNGHSETPPVFRDHLY